MELIRLENVKQNISDRRGNHQSRRWDRFYGGSG